LRGIDRGLELTHRSASERAGESAAREHQRIVDVDELARAEKLVSGGVCRRRRHGPQRRHGLMAVDLVAALRDRASGIERPLLRP
jgi:hypothetical protein